MTAPEPEAKPPGGGSGPIAYCWAQLRIRTDGTAGISVTGCVVNSDGTLAQISAAGEYQFDVGAPLTYGMGTSELTTAVTNALSASWGITGLADVKFIPSF